MILENKKNTFIWNTIGNVANALLSLVLLIVVNWFLGREDGGLFSFAFSNAYVFYTIGVFSVRAFQVTDVENLHKTEHYIALRFISCTVMILSVLIFVVFSSRSIYESWVVILLALFKCVDALSDVFQGSLQSKGRLDIAGKGMFYRAMLSGIFFTAFVIFLHNLLLGSFFAVIANLVVFLLYDFKQASKYDVVRPAFDLGFIRPIFISCLPIFLSDLLWRYIFIAPKYSIKSMLSDSLQNVFGIISMPASTINLIGIFLFYPLLVGFAKKYQQNEKRQFVRTIYALIGLLAFFTVLAEIITYFIGVPLLNIAYHIDVTQYKFDLLWLMLAGGLGATSNIFTYVLTIMRRQTLLLLGNFFSAIFAVVVSQYCVKNYGLYGASIANVLIMAFLFCILLVLSAFAILFRWRKGKEA